MVVEDEPDLLTVTKYMLENAGNTVHGFSSPEQALAHVRDEGCRECTIVVSDIRMPGMSGFELVRQLKELHPTIKVILMTAFKTNKEEAQIVLPSTKVEAFINKPFKTSDLLEAIKEAGRSAKSG
jgi:CheY-like chemotaxis protein